MDNNRYTFLRAEHARVQNKYTYIAVPLSLIFGQLALPESNFWTNGIAVSMLELDPYLCVCL